MNTFVLKLIAITSMIIDHYGAIFAPHEPIFRYIGRLAFPIFAFLLVEGFIHTRDIKKYGQRLLIFAFISEIPFDLAFYGSLGFEHQNIFFTLFIGLVMMYYLEKSENTWNKASIVSIAMIAAFIFIVDYNIVGILYILMFYLTKDMVRIKRLPLIALALFIVHLSFFGVFNMTQQFALLSLPLLYFYNGRLGPVGSWTKHFFYLFYPLHLGLFYLIQII